MYPSFKYGDIGDALCRRGTQSRDAGGRVSNATTTLPAVGMPPEISEDGIPRRWFTAERSGEVLNALVFRPHLVEENRRDKPSDVAALWCEAANFVRRISHKSYWALAQDVTHPIAGRRRSDLKRERSPLRQLARQSSRDRREPPAQQAGPQESSQSVISSITPAAIVRIGLALLRDSCSLD
jgi:hypothetical protein